MSEVSFQCDETLDQLPEHGLVTNFNKHKIDEFLLLKQCKGLISQWQYSSVKLESWKWNNQYRKTQWYR